MKRSEVKRTLIEFFNIYKSYKGIIYKHIYEVAHIKQYAAQTKKTNSVITVFQCVCVCVFLKTHTHAKDWVCILGWKTFVQNG